MRYFGFSTGAVAKDDVAKATRILRDTTASAVEVSALRLHELTNAARYVLDVPIDRFSYVSFHAPSSFAPSEEKQVLAQLAAIAERGWPIVVHPDVIFTPAKWQQLGGLLLIENMDQRKPFGRTAEELSAVFSVLSNASLCFDFGHARQIDPTMTEAFRIVNQHGRRLKQIHLSDVDAESKHHPLNIPAVKAFFRIAPLIERNVAIILEAVVSEGQQLADQLHMAQFLFAAADAQRYMTAKGTAKKAMVPAISADNPEEEVQRLRSTTEQLHSASLDSFERIVLTYAGMTESAPDENWGFISTDQQSIPRNLVSECSALNTGSQR